MATDGSLEECEELLALFAEGQTNVTCPEVSDSAGGFSSAFPDASSSEIVSVLSGWSSST